jgi:predicted TIM-barrel fold metal-dependent hydrolase
VSVLDCDVHCAVPSPATLYPYLPEHWSDYLDWTEFREPSALGATYPSWLPMLRTDGSAVTLERVREDVLSRADAAVLHCFYGVECFTHPYLAPALATAVNRWLEAEWLERDERLLASAVVTPQHIEAAVAEVHRIAEQPRFVQVLVPARAPAPYGEQRYWPIWEAAAEHGLTVGITFGGGTGTPTTPVNWLSSFFEEYVTASLAFQAHAMSLAMSGLFDRHPELRFFIYESGWTWLPSLYWRMDQEWRAYHREVPWLDGPPSSYVRRFFRFSTSPTDAPPDEQQLRGVLGQLGSDELLVFGSDYPHRYTEDAEPILGLLTPEQAERVLWSNAADCFRSGVAATP